MKTKPFMVLVLGGFVCGAYAQYAFVTGATPVSAPAPPARPTHAAASVQPVRVVPSGYYTAVPHPAVVASAPVVLAEPTVSYSVLGHSQIYSCSIPPVIYHVPAPNVVYFGRPESHLRNHLNQGYARTQSSVVYFGRGEAVQRGYWFNYCR